MKLLRALWRRLTKPPVKVPGHPPLTAPATDGSDAVEPPRTAAALTDWDLLSEDEQALFEQLAPTAPEKEIRYPPPAEQSTQDWVTERLEKLTGGMTRHPYDLTNYPTPPTPADLAAREWAKTNNVGARALFSHGYSMRYLHELKARAECKDITLSAEDLMALRARGLC